MRALLAAVIVMGVMILIGTAVLISVVVQRATRRPPPAALASGPPAAMPPAEVSVLALDQPPGTRIIGTARQSDKILAVTLAGGGAADRVLIWDLSANRVVATLRLSR